jgi:hypothetical protein
VQVVNRLGLLASSVMDEFRLFPDLEGLLRKLWRQYQCHCTYLSGGSC